MATGFARPNFARLLDSATEQQQLLGNSGLTGVRVTDDGKGTPFIDFFLIEHSFHATTPYTEKAGQKPA
ncbi:hypothetical protein SDC9_202824 [bioreactor metagenome]|uniref:Uncharacterized protein n=1 Tax=bioreactor metagenome TaxID=1076179 RepID=A0A645IUP8_9ZZZZ